MKLNITLLALVTGILFSCSPDNDEINIYDDSADRIIVIDGGTTGDPTATSYQTDLMAGQHIISGIVGVDVVDDNVVVSYSTDGDWVIDETHLYIGPLSQLPTTGSGNPKVGHFPYKDTFSTGVTNVEYVGPGITEGECVYIAAHAVVTNTVTGQTETAWGNGDPIGGNSWAMMFEYCY